MAVACHRCDELFGSLFHIDSDGSEAKLMIREACQASVAKLNQRLGEDELVARHVRRARLLIKCTKGRGNAGLLRLLGTSHRPTPPLSKPSLEQSRDEQRKPR